MNTTHSFQVPKAPWITPGGEIVSAPQGQIGEKIAISGIVLFQESKAVDTLAGRAYSHFHVIADDLGNMYHYRGSTFFPKGSRVDVIATIKGYCKGNVRKAVITVIKAPKKHL